MENAQNAKIGAFICELRKQNNLTQKEVADYLGVTDKAVSKWERGLSCPDISLIIPLSKLLGISTSEILSGEKKTVALPIETETIVEEVLVYSNNDTKMRLRNVTRIGFTIFTIAALLSIGICLICDITINGNLSWSLIVFSSIIFGWLLTLPFFQFKKNIIRNTLIVLSLLILPYLFLLGVFIGHSLIYNLGAAIAGISLAALWCIYAVCLKLRNKKLSAIGLSFLILIPCSFSINLVIPTFIKESVVQNNSLSYAFTLLLAICCFVAEYILSRKEY